MSAIVAHRLMETLKDLLDTRVQVDARLHRLRALKWFMQMILREGWHAAFGELCKDIYPVAH